MKYKICEDCNKILGIYKSEERHRHYVCEDCSIFNATCDIHLEMLFFKAQSKRGNRNYVHDEAEGLFSNVVRAVEDSY